MAVNQGIQELINSGIITKLPANFFSIYPIPSTTKTTLINATIMKERA